MRVFPALVTLLFSLVLITQTQAKSTAQVKKSSRKVAESSATIHVSTNVIADQTQFEIVKKGANQSFPLNIPEGYQLEAQNTVENERFLIFTYQYTTFDSGSSQFLLIDKKTLKLIKRKVIGSFNITEPLIYNDRFFVAAAGYVAEFKLNDGSEVWEFTNFFGRPHFFNGVLDGQSIEVRGDLVLFGPNFTVNRRRQQIVPAEAGQ